MGNQAETDDIILQILKLVENLTKKNNENPSNLPHWHDAEKHATCHMAGSLSYYNLPWLIPSPPLQFFLELEVEVHAFNLHSSLDAH